MKCIFKTYSAEIRINWCEIKADLNTSILKYMVTFFINHFFIFIKEIYWMKFCKKKYVFYVIWIDMILRVIQFHIYIKEIFSFLSNNKKMYYKCFTERLKIYIFTNIYIEKNSIRKRLFVISLFDLWLRWKAISLIQWNVSGYLCSGFYISSFWINVVHKFLFYLHSDIYSVLYFVNIAICDILLYLKK